DVRCDEGGGEGARRPVRRRPRSRRHERLGPPVRAEGAGLRRPPRPCGLSEARRRGRGQGREGARDRPAAAREEVTDGTPAGGACRESDRGGVRPSPPLAGPGRTRRLPPALKRPPLATAGPHPTRTSTPIRPPLATD